MNRNLDERSVFICAGEVSGDLRGADLMRAMKAVSERVRFSGIGGDAMIASGLECFFHIKDMSIIGFYEVLRQFPKILKIFRRTVSKLREQQPDYLILIDYPGFNLRLAKKAKQMEIPVIYYISPQVWAWGRKRVKRIASVVDTMVVIFPFEEALYREAGVDVVFTGHPLKDKVKPAVDRETFFRTEKLDPLKTTIGLLPGSRHQEIERLLPAMVEAVTLMRRKDPDLQVILGKSPVIGDPVYQGILNETPDIRSVRHKVYEVMAYSDVVVVASGTATLEAALLETPMVIVYKVSRAEYIIARRIIKIDFIGLANIVAGRSLVPELIQHEANASRIAEEISRYLEDDQYKEEVISGLRGVSEALGIPGAARRSARAILDFMERTER